jgi:ABC-2 type transport system permease protein
VKSQELDAPSPAWAEAAPPTLEQNRLASFIRQCLALGEMELRKLRHDPTELATRAIQPALWLAIFGEVFSRVRGIPTTGQMRYMDFLAPGVLAQSVLFIGIFYGIAVIWERDLGIIHKLLVSPAPRVALVFGKAISGGVRGLSQGVAVYLLAWFLGVGINWNPVALAGVALAILLGAATFATFSLIIACIVRTRERFMGIGQVLTMPLFFASNAVYPISIMPGWLKVAAHLNPLTYEVDAMRALMVRGGNSVFGLGLDFGVLILATLILSAIAARMYVNLVR